MSGDDIDGRKADAVIELQGVVKEYGQDPPLRVLHGVDLRIAESELVAIVGASGSGKSTLLAIMGALDDPTSGRVLVDGVDLAGMPERERAALRARRIGFVFQQFFLLPSLSALQNVGLGLIYSGVPAAEREKRAAHVLERVGLDHRLRHRPGQLSGGEQQRVAIARALVGRPAVLFADEPTGSLDSATGRSILDLLIEVAGAGTTVVTITHDRHVASRMSREISISDGRIVGDSAGMAA